MSLFIIKVIPGYVLLQNSHWIQWIIEEYQENRQYRDEFLLDNPIPRWDLPIHANEQERSQYREHKEDVPDRYGEPCEIL